MSQIRLFVSGTEAETARALDRMGEAFEDDGFAMGTMEIDEDADLWEASLYLGEEDEAEQVGNRLAAALADAGLEGRTIGREILPHIDWVAKSLEGLAPVRAGRFLVHGSHDRAKVRPVDRAIEIDAGQAFGTGHHGTTAGCLLMIQSLLNRQRVRRALDLGTGSGVLAIALRKLQPVHVLATDIDPVATGVARANARNNHAPDIRFETAAGFHAPVFAAEGPFDLIVANILARPLMAMAPDIRTHLAPGGAVILSGILAEQRWKVLAAFNAQHLRHVRTLWRGGWVTILLR